MNAQLSKTKDNKLRVSIEFTPPKGYLQIRTAVEVPVSEETAGRILQAVILGNKEWHESRTA